MSELTIKNKRQECHLHPKAAEKEHKDNKEDNSSPFWGSIGWKEEWATNRSKIIRVDDLSKLTNRVVFGLEKGITKSPISSAKFHLWEILKALVRPDCLSMQTDIKNFYKKLLDDKNLKQKSTVKMQRTGTPKVLFFQDHQIKRLSLMVKLP